ncbi:5-oxoprolinase subunit PxpA [Pseudonocardia sp. C8]|uniref:LamB/YcsF family protein n=1 Tax=Pseudonocardia sp. C8 TaxID=2762759 RepID=UPI001642C48A|nr:5-oxoprolinase subunit PxpA [Pseudonocardia sp. C8]MBC3191089.1 5-oxoprolinase subunit PxpA [Pseudonocardia sp. C8]
MTTAIDVVADLGEAYGAYRMADDSAMLRLVSSANLACGFHAGDPRVMDATVAACRRAGVSVGAHPGFPDLVGFGRRDMTLTRDEIRTDVLYQVGALSAFTTAHRTAIAHLTAHGRLGNLVVTETEYALGVADAVEQFDPGLIILTQEGELARIARERGLEVGIIGMADRAYLDDGTLVPRRETGAVIHDEDVVAARTVRMVTEGLVESINGKDLPVTCDTVLVHGDSPGAVALATRIRADLEEAGVRIAPVGEILADRSTATPA